MSRRDDLEAVGYVLIYLHNGSLPWQNQGRDMQNKNKRYEEIKEIKSTIHLDELCKDCPIELKQYLKYCKELQFSEEPDYELL